MSSLQKFHRRTNNAVAVVSPFATVGSGNDTVGYYVGSSFDGINKLIIAPAATEAYRQFGSSGTSRGTTSTTDGLANTNTLYSYGATAHPAAYYCKTLATGGYNTWYLPAKDEMSKFISASSALPTAAKNSDQRWMTTSTENDATTMFRHFNQLPINILTLSKSDTTTTYNNLCRAFRRTTV
jgi:hypothetical protein